VEKEDWEEEEKEKGGGNKRGCEEVRLVHVFYRKKCILKQFSNQCMIHVFYEKKTSLSLTIFRKL
jgi:hypothetical protein